MTIEELEKQIASLQEEVRKLKEIKTAEPRRIAEGEQYYLVSIGGDIIKVIENHTPVDTGVFQFGNYYYSKELVERDLDEIRLRNRIRLFHDTLCQGYQFENNKCNWYIYYSLTEMEYCVSWSSSSKLIGTVYFDTQKHAQQVCDILNTESKIQMYEVIYNGVERLLL